MNGETAKVLDESFDYDRVEALLQDFLGKKGVTVPVLQRIQAEFGYLPRPAMEYMAKRLRIPLSKVFGVATFYAQFHLKPRGKNIIRVCRGTACHVRGGANIAEEMQEILKVGVGETTEDMRFTYEEVACIGACGLAPVIMINDRTYGRLTTDKLKGILDEY
ncbi:MAG TPA: NADH-quinone oxidoreductase subunit NuoE [Firmicutes bacterium]|nr:NADH-quinone oxidoreductase subunit NuoE [Bacillota bacterium]